MVCHAQMDYLCRRFMKRMFRIFTAVLLAGIVVYVGSGVNLYTYCCDDCRAEGVSAVAEHRCCDIHHHDHDEAVHVPEGHHSLEHGHACAVERIAARWTHYVHKINIEPDFSYLNPLVFGTGVETEFPFVEPLLLYSDTQKPPNLSEETYFDLLNMLII